MFNSGGCKHPAVRSLAYLRVYEIQTYKSSTSQFDYLGIYFIRGRKAELHLWKYWWIFWSN